MTQMELENEFDIEALLEAPYKKNSPQPLVEPPPSNQEEGIKSESGADNEILRGVESGTGKPTDDTREGTTSKHPKGEKRREKKRDNSRDRHSSGKSSRERSRKRSHSRSRDRRRSHYSPDRRYRYDDRDRDYRRRRSRHSKSPEDDRRRRRSPPPRPRSPVPVTPVNPQERDKRTVFCQQLSARLQNRDLYDFLSVCGRIREAKIVMDKMNRRSKGVAYVEFYAEDSVPKAIGMTGQKLFGIPIIISASESEKNAEAEAKAAAAEQTVKEKVALPVPEVMTNKLLVGNLAMSVTEEDLTQSFSECGKLTSVKLHVDSYTGRSKGFALITYNTTYDARYAIKKFHGASMKGKEIEVRPFNDGDERLPNHKDLDDSEVQGVSLNSLSRVELMAKLAHREDAAVPNNVNEDDQESQCVLLKNMFDQSETLDPNFLDETESDVLGECSKYGKIKHLAVDPNSIGFIYLKFEDVESAKKAIASLNGRYFAGRELSAVFMSPAHYHSLHPAAL